jgi:hypothetical protein
MARKTASVRKKDRVVVYLDSATKAALARLTEHYGSSSVSETVRRAIADFDKSLGN